MENLGTIFKESLTDALTLTTGVPPGSMLGLILFLLYMNNISNNCEFKRKTTSFADDTDISFVG